MLFRVNSPAILNLGGAGEKRFLAIKQHPWVTSDFEIEGSWKVPRPAGSQGIAADGMAHWPQEELATDVLMNASLCISHLISQQRKAPSMVPQGAQRTGEGVI